MILKNDSVENFFAEVQGKRIVAFGASKYLEIFCRQFSYLELEQKITYISDNNSSLHYTRFKLNNTEVPILPLSEIIKREGSELVVLITSTVYAHEIYLQLSSDQTLKNMDCYVLPLILYQTELEEARKNKQHEKTLINGKQRIPKKIHGCWFSGEKKPELYQKCIDSWKRYCPDYEIIEWNQDNYDVTKNLFMRQALEAKRWAIVSDYARLDLVYNHGGIYMDMDLELIKGLDDLLYHRAYFSFDSYNCVEMGASFGAEAGTKVLKTMMERYESIPYYNERGGVNLTPQPIHMLQSFQEIGLTVNGKYQEIEGMAFYPMVYFCPIDIDLGLSVATDQTRGIHHFGDGWFAAKQADEKKKKLEGLRTLYHIAYN